MKTSPLKNVDSGQRVALLNGTITVIDAAKAVVPSVLVQSILSTVSNILAIAKNTLQNEGDFRDLIEHCRVICDVVVRATEDQTDGDLDSELSDIIIDLKSFIQSIHEAVVSANERSIAQRAISALSDKVRIASWARELDRRVLLINMQLSMITQRRLCQQSRQVNRPSVSTAAPYEVWRVVLPSVPSPFFGRDHLIPLTTELLLNRRHVTLFGPGGIGKTSLAKAIIHDSVIAERFQGRRYFVSFDELDAFRISPRVVRERICRAAGLDVRLGEQWEEVIDFMTGADTILVIDHADALTAARNANSVARIIDDLASSSSVVLLLTTRSKHTAPYFVTQVVSVSTLERKDARKTFQSVCPQHIPTEIIDELLDGVDNHPLSVNIIARKAAQHEWSGAELLSAWKTNQAALLENGEGKSRSLRATVELSLNAPSVIALGDDARKLLGIIAFFPQGLKTMRVKALYPSATADVDALCAHSIIHCEENRFTMLTPVRLYLGHKAPNPDAGLLNTIRNIYYKELSGPIERRRALVEAEDVNVERLIDFDFNRAINLHDSSRACVSFMDSLAICKPRVTILTTRLEELPMRSSGILAKVTGRPAKSKAVSLRMKTLLVTSAGTLASSIRRSTLTSTFLRTLFVRVNLQNSTLPTENLRASTNPRRLRQLQTAARPFLRINRQPVLTTTPTATIKRIHSCASLPSFYSLLQKHRGVLAFFTTEMCRLSRKAQPLFEEFAHDKSSNSSPVAFVQVDLNASRGAAAIGIEFGIRATPTFMFCVGGMKVYEVQGCDVQQLRMQLSMFLHPVHPHLSLSLPALDLLGLTPILFKQEVPNLAVVSEKLKSFLDSTTTWFQPFDTSLSKADTMEILFGTVIPYIEAFTPSQCLDLWHDVTSSMSWNMPEDQLFPLVDLWRRALLDEKVSSWCADRNGLDSPPVLLLSNACERSSKKYLLTLLRMLSNAFSNKALGWKILLSAQNNLAVLLEHTLVYEDTEIRKSASSLTFNIFARLQELRIENLCKGDEEGADHLEMEISMTLLNAEWEASIACAVLAAIERESDGDIVHRQVAALGLIVRFSPFIDHLLRLLGVLYAQRTLKNKFGGNEGNLNMQKTAWVLLQEVADKLCPPSVSI